MAEMAESEVTRLFGTGASIDPFSVDKCIGRRITEVDLANQAFPGRIICASGAESPAVYVITNLVGSGPTSEPVLSGGQHWHTDIEFEPVPLSTSMFFVQQMPLSRSRGTGTWVNNPPREPGFYHPGSPPT